MALFQKNTLVFQINVLGLINGHGGKSLSDCHSSIFFPSFYYFVRGGEIWKEHTASRHGLGISTILIGKVKFRGNIVLLGMESQFLPF